MKYDSENGHSNSSRTCNLRVEGLDCADCALRIERAVSQLPTVEKVRVSAVDQSLRAQGADINHQEIAEVVRGLGYKPIKVDGKRKTTLRIPAMDCPDEEKMIRLGLERVDASVLAVNLKAQTITVSHSFGRSQLLNIFRELGFPATVSSDKPPLERGIKRITDLILTFLPLVATILGAVLQFNGQPQIVTVPIYLAAILVGGYGFAKKGILAALRFSLDMNTLMTLAVLGAVALGDWLEAATVVFLFSLAHHLESRSMDRARRAISELMKLAPQTAIVKRDGEEVEVDVSEVEIGDTMIVKPGASIPLDGTIRAGSSSVNQAPITGESMPVAKSLGDNVFAGSINGEGTLEVETTSVEEGSTISRIIHLVQEAQTGRTPTERFVDKFARFYTPAVVLSALVTTIALPLFIGDWTVWFYRALVLLVIACPCALVISTPVGIVSGLTALARAGVLVKGGDHLETAAKVDVVTFDKTGTLTIGMPVVREVIPLDEADEDEILRCAASLERRSEHHLAKAIVAEARKRGLMLSEPVGVRAIPGKGVEGVVDGSPVRIGNHKMFHEAGICGSDCACGAVERQAAGMTLVCVGIEDRLLGAVLLSDELRPDAGAALEALHGIDDIKAAMLTGDNRPTAEQIAAQLGIDDFEAEMLPQDKLASLRSWQDSGYTVMMVGDGVNDAPAIAAADVGVAMGAAGTDVALETADIALMGDDISKVPATLKHSRKTMRIIRQNIFLSILIKAAFVLMAALGLATLWMAITADMGVSLAVIANSLRLLRVE